MSTRMPEDFYSDGDDKPFLNCKVCERELNGSGVPYTIEKAYKRTQEGEDVTLFEVAICIPCAEKQAQKMSKEYRSCQFKIAFLPTHGGGGGRAGAVPAPQRRPGTFTRKNGLF